SYRSLDDAVLGVRLRTGCVLFVRNAKQDRRTYAVLSRGLGLTHKLVYREVEAAGHRLDIASHSFAFTCKQRIDEIVGRESGLADHCADRFGAPQSSWSVNQAHLLLPWLWMNSVGIFIVLRSEVQPGVCKEFSRTARPTFKHQASSINHHAVLSVVPRG